MNFRIMRLAYFNRSHSFTTRWPTENSYEFEIQRTQDDFEFRRSILRSKVEKAIISYSESQHVSFVMTRLFVS